MVNLTNIVQGRKPLLIYGVKRGKVPSKLRPNLLPKKQDLGRAQCLEEMYTLLACWKRNAYDDSYCTEHVTSFMNCVTSQLETGNSRSRTKWTQDEVNATLEHYTPYLRRPRSH